MKKLRDWGIKHLKDLEIGNYMINFSGYSIVYSADDHTHLLIFDNEIHIEPETFYFIPPNSSLQVIGKPESAMLLWFTVDLFVDRLEFLTHIKSGIFFRNTLGFGMKNTFMPHNSILKYYYLPTQKGQINKLFARNLLSNFLEFLLIRTLLEIDPKMEGFRNDTYEKEIANKLILVLHQETNFSFKMEYYANKLNITKRTLDNAIKSVYGCTTKRFVNAKAVQRAKKLLRGTDIPIKIISMNIGFSEESNFSNFFKKNTGSSPRQYREQALNQATDLKAQDVKASDLLNPIQKQPL
ncbi:AraC family transcriptional regulator [Chryseobacterium sp. MDT2-18]|uniref:helix-turn-helix domain-containing protein n=1 Tax=Chryseobacterium sp. MDT2-18 TaxID=1259136 RepID=UPI002782F6B6|nr:helix-turn-helix domain-containing protein [Chryseobacterium sp. MDT2-18]MDQ0477953.1 AraC-like DNA-binding protein [Chryseobacterium sp. MDT2-18]